MIASLEAQANNNTGNLEVQDGAGSEEQVATTSGPSSGGSDTANENALSLSADTFSPLTFDSEFLELDLTQDYSESPYR